MYKPDSLRQFLTAAVPQLAQNPERLSVFIDAGSVVASYAPGLSWEYSYKLNLILTDFAGDPDTIMAPMVAWMRTNQPEAFANADLRDHAITFEADLISNAAVDLSITLQLTERAICIARQDGGYDVTHPPEPQPEAALPAEHWQLYVRDELVAEWDQPAA